MEQENSIPVIGTEATEGTVPQTPAPSKRQEYISRLAKRYPDKHYGDDSSDDDIYGAASEAYDADQQELAVHRRDSRSIKEMFERDPRNARFFLAMRDGADPDVELMKLYGPEIRDILDNIEDPEMQQKLAQAQQEFLERAAQSRKLQDEYEANLPLSLEALDKAQEEYGISDEERDRAMALLLKIQTDALRGIFAPESMLMALKALNYEQDMAQADAVGEIRGRNAKIDAKLRRQGAGDGLPVIGGSNTAGEPAESDDIFDIAEGARV